MKAMAPEITLDRLVALTCNADTMANAADVSPSGSAGPFRVNDLAHALLVKLCHPGFKKTCIGASTNARLGFVTSLEYRYWFSRRV